MRRNGQFAFVNGLDDKAHMDPIHDLTVTLALIPERALDGLRAAIEGSPDFTPGLLAWLEHAVDWEINRRAGHSYRLQGPRAAIDDSEIGQSLVTLAMLTGVFRDSPSPESTSVAPFLELAATILRAEVERPDELQ